MNKTLKTALAILIIISLALAIGSCGGGGNNPKSLAKQTFEITQEFFNLSGFDDPKYAELEKKSGELKPKVEKLSEADKKIYDEELERLKKEAGW